MEHDKFHSTTILCVLEYIEDAVSVLELYKMTRVSLMEWRALYCLYTPSSKNEGCALSNLSYLVLVSNTYVRVLVHRGVLFLDYPY